MNAHDEVIMRHALRARRAVFVAVAYMCGVSVVVSVVVTYLAVRLMMTEIELARIAAPCGVP